MLTLARPDKRNALSDEMVLGVERFFTILPSEVAAVVIAAADGDHFSAGLDLAEMSARDTIAGVRHSRCGTASSSRSSSVRARAGL